MTDLKESGVGPQFSAEAQPIVYDGVIYLITSANNVFVISVDTGEITWSCEANLDPDVGKVVYCGWTSRGGAIGEGKVYVGQLDGKLLALDQRTGQMICGTQQSCRADRGSYGGVNPVADPSARNM